MIGYIDNGKEKSNIFKYMYKMPQTETKLKYKEANVRREYYDKMQKNANANIANKMEDKVPANFCVSYVYT